MAISGKRTRFALDSSVPTLTDISANLNNIQFPRRSDLHEVTVFGDDHRQYITGFKGGEITLAGFWDATFEAFLFGIWGVDATQTYEYGPDGATAGKPRWSGECRLVDFDSGSQVDAPTPISARLQCVGPITLDVYPT